MMLNLFHSKFGHFLAQAVDAPADDGVWMPPEASTFAADVDGLYMFILYLCTIFFVVMMVAMVYFAVKYRRRGPNDRTSPISHNFKLEFLWSAIPTVLLFTIFAWGQIDYVELATPPGDAIDLRVTGAKWNWTFRYPKLEKECSNGDNVELKSGLTVQRPARIVVPIHQPVKVTMSSVDVIHSLWIPAFRLKKDVLPSRYTGYWFEATKLGTFDIYCAEYCGKDHSVMTAKVKVVSQEDFDKWVASDDCPAISDDDGKGLFKKFGCSGCHYTDRDGRKTGPSLKGIWGRTEKHNNGTVTITGLEGDNYLKDSIYEPNKDIVDGYTAQMSSFAGRINDAQLTAIIDYLKTLK